MTREQIEKAAGEYSGSVLGFKDNPVVMNKHKAFMDGAQWRVNSVWHDDISECKDIKRWIVVEYNNGYVDVLPDIRDLDGVKDLVVRVVPKERRKRNELRHGYVRSYDP